MRKLTVFTVRLLGRPADLACEVEAHFLTTPSMGSREPLRFWIKPHWYSRRRCVAAFDWQFVISALNEPEKTEDWVKAAGVKL